MTLNITAISSALPAPVSAEPRSRPIVDENSMRLTHKVNDSSTSSGVVPTPPELGAKSQEAKSQEAKSQEAKSQEAKSQDRKTLAGAIDEVNQHFKSLPKTHLQFTIDEKADRVVVKVMDAEKNKLIRQIPPEDLLKLAASIKEKINEEGGKPEQAGLVANKSSTEASPLDSFLLRDRV